MCLYPQLQQNKKYVMNKKNGGDIPPINDIRVLAVPRGCGKCMECRKQYAREWQVRLLEDVRHNKNGKFITLTFSNESITKLAKEIKGLSGYELDNEIATLAVRRFTERWRKEYKKTIRHWLVTELGHNGTENLHLHGIVWTDESLDKVEKHWKYGHIWKGVENGMGGYDNYVNERTANYITKYIAKVDEVHKYYKSKILTSKGIGIGYLNRPDSKGNKYKGEETNEAFTSRTGHKMAMPKYWRNKIYTDEEREKLWLIKLDKQERWVNGTKVDISNGEDEYWELVKQERLKNKRLGYGDDEVNWERKRYENERRRFRMKQRNTE